METLEQHAQRETTQKRKDKDPLSDPFLKCLSSEELQELEEIDEMMTNLNKPYTHTECTIERAKQDAANWRNQNTDLPTRAASQQACLH